VLVCNARKGIGGKHYMQDYAPKDNARRQAHHQNGDY